MKSLLIILSLCTSVGLAQNVIPQSDLLQQSERRQAVINQRIHPPIDVRSSFGELSVPAPQSRVTGHCFPVHTLILQSVTNEFPRGTDNDLIAVLSEQKITVSRYSNNNFSLVSSGVGADAPCVSAGTIEQIIAQLQNHLIGRGLITTRVLTPEQDLKTGELTLSVAIGKIAGIEVNQDNVDKSHANRANVATAFPAGTADTLNLRDLEQGLENLRRLPSVTAKMEIDAGEAANTSNVKVDWYQRKYPFRLNLSIDDSGGNSTGKYLGTIGLSWDNPLHLNDMLSASYTRNLKAGEKHTDPLGQTDHGETYNYSLSYSVPFGYWSIDTGISHYFYDQAVAGLNRNYHYTGDSDQGHIKVSRVLYRDGNHKITASAGIWKKSTKNYIDDAEIDVQHRRTGGWKASLSQRSYFEAGTLTSTLGYKRGTRAFGAIEAPEALFDEGTAKSKIWTVDVDWQMPFKLGQQAFSWNSAFNGQWNQTKLTAQDKFAIGGRYSVRGFTGAKSLSAERGWYLRNDLGWHYHDNHQIYVGLDVGHVSGESAKNLSGQTLSGAVLGLKGGHQYHGNWSYDVFAGVPVKEPHGFEADDWVSGFTLGYSY